ncbi:PD-(D/E)XK nuclease family protein, partial [Candidatus Sumerlaeota bacterium]|nr:PD-(D/E)XK nuclease family protein [Candidatus Sumerlaeota bacterium]
MCANFVDVVGFQLERVHTGVIAWLLGGEPLPLPLEERGAVLRKLEPRLSDLGDLATLKAKREYSLGRRRRIDLVLETSFKNDKKAFLLIEFKVDSDVYLSQLEESERDFSAHEPNKPLLFVIVLALGAAQFTLKHQLPEIEKKRY